MPANNSISLVSLDFDTIKSNLVSYLRGNPAFADFNFEGSNINVLLDILSYNTYLQSFYLNMVASEMFLDSAQLRNSVVSLSKSLNYTPRSYKSSRLNIFCQFPQSGLSAFNIPVGTKFSAKNSNGSFTFVTRDSNTIYPSGGEFSANLVVYEGKYLSDVFTVDNTVESQRFLISNQNIDNDSLTVTVIASGTPYNFTPASSLFGVSNTSNVFFIQAAENNYYEIVFGDGVFGSPPLNGSTVLANYMVTSGTDGNGAMNVQLDDNLGSFNGSVNFIIPSISVSNSSFNGANSESIESIRFNAPRSLQTQERAVTANDYKQLVLNNYSDVKSVHVFGGEQISGAYDPDDNMNNSNSVQFGKVFIVPATHSGYNLSDSEKADIQSFLLERNVLGITPQVVDPAYLYLNVYTTVKYDPTKTANPPATISNIVSNAIQAYNSNNLESFDTEFKLSDFMAAITNSEQSISSNQTTVNMKKVLTPSLNTPQYLTVSYNNAINVGSVFSSAFLANGRECSFTDFNPNNNTFNFTQTSTGLQINNNSNVIYLLDSTIPSKPTYTTAGTIDYSRGIISLNQITINDFLANEGVTFIAQPASENVKAYNNDIIEIDIISGINIQIATV